MLHIGTTGGLWLFGLFQMITIPGFIVLALGRHRNGSAARLLTLDQNGRELGTLEVQGEVQGLSAGGRWISVLYQDRLVLYDPVLYL